MTTGSFSWVELGWCGKDEEGVGSLDWLFFQIWTECVWGRSQSIIQTVLKNFWPSMRASTNLEDITREWDSQEGMATWEEHKVLGNTTYAGSPRNLLPLWRDDTLLFRPVIISACACAYAGVRISRERRVWTTRLTFMAPALRTMFT